MVMHHQAGVSVWNDITFTTHPDGRIQFKHANGKQGFAHAAKHNDTWWIHVDGMTLRCTIYEQGAGGSAAGGGYIAPMPGKILEVLCHEGQRVNEGDTLMILEAMKMEHRILAQTSGIVRTLHFQTSQQVDQGAQLIEIDDEV